MNLRPRVMDVLVYLARRQGELVSARELVDELWPRVVGDENAKVTIAKLRKVLGDDSKNPIYIETVPKRGYRFIAEVRRNGADT